MATENGPNNFCRLCMAVVNPGYIDLALDSTMLSSEDADYLRNAIKSCYDIELNSNNSITQKVCLNCVNLVRVFYSSQQYAQCVNRILLDSNRSFSSVNVIPESKKTELESSTQRSKKKKWMWVIEENPVKKDIGTVIDMRNILPHKRIKRLKGYTEAEVRQRLKEIRNKKINADKRRGKAPRNKVSLPQKQLCPTKDVPNECKKSNHVKENPNNPRGEVTKETPKAHSPLHDISYGNFEFLVQAKNEDNFETVGNPSQYSEPFSEVKVVQERRASSGRTIKPTNRYDDD